MKKIKFIILIILLFPIFARAEEKESDYLIYDVETVEINGDKITFSGWAFVNGMHTIGGQNYKIFIYAVETEKILNYNDSTVSKIKGTNSLELSGSGNFGANRLYPSTCVKTNVYTKSGKSGEKISICSEVQPGFYGNKEIEVENGLDKTIYYHRDTGKAIGARGYASCAPSDDFYSSCVHYDPNFKISFNLNDIREKFGNKDISFVIEIKYRSYAEKGGIYVGEDIDGKCRWYEGKYIGCDIYDNTDWELKKFRVFKRLSFSELVLKSSASYVEGSFDEINVEKIDAATTFKITTGIGGLRNDDGIKHENAATTTYFTNGGVFNVSGSKMVTPGSAGTGLDVPEMRLYGLTTVNFNDGFTCKKDEEKCVTVNPGSSKTAYAWSSWGVFPGEFVLKLNPAPSPYAFSCKKPTVTPGCKESSYTISNCEKGVEFIDSSVNLNLDGCSEELYNSYYSIVKGYVFEEKNNLVMNNPDFEKHYSPGIGVLLNFTFFRYIDWSTSDDYMKFYYVKYWHKDNLGQCVPVGGYVTREYLNSKGVDLSNEDALLDAKASNLIGQKHSLKYKYPDSNNVNNSVYSSSRYISDVSYENITKGNTIEYDYSINNAYIKRDNSEKCYNSEQCNNANYLNGEKKYYIPFNINKFPTSLKFITQISNSSMLIDDINLETICYMNIIGGPLEEAKYRVIDLSDPFPNNEPSSTHATNWLNLWNSRASDTFLFDRRYANDVESYILDLNISKIREYNDSKLNYLDTSINVTNPDNGRSSFISNEYFNRVNIRNRDLTRVGKGEVDT